MIRERKPKPRCKRRKFVISRAEGKAQLCPKRKMQRVVLVHLYYDQKDVVNVAKSVVYQDGKTGIKWANLLIEYEVCESVHRAIRWWHKHHEWEAV